MKKKKQQQGTDVPDAQPKGSSVEVGVSDDSDDSSDLDVRGQASKFTKSFFTDVNVEVVQFIDATLHARELANKRGNMHADTKEATRHLDRLCVRMSKLYWDRETGVFKFRV